MREALRPLLQRKENKTVVKYKSEVRDGMRVDWDVPACFSQYN